ncbi:MAG: type II toxin-antitoxin system PemK/MazF family toxin [Planctomycetota bacterium]
MIAFFTSRVEQAGPDDVMVAASADNGLAVDSAALVTKLFTLHESLIVRTLGRLGKSDHQALVERLVNLLRSTVDV